MTTMTSNAPNRLNWNLSRMEQFHQVPNMYFDGFDAMPDNTYLLSPSIVNIVDNSQRIKSSTMDLRSEEEAISILSVPEITQEKSQVSTYTAPTSSSLPDLVCGVCGAPAHGYNFDQISCESCKAFFRRNALRHMPHLKCRFSGSCVITVQTRRQCTYCRLKKCFDIKMRKEWIRTEEERKLRQLKNLMKQEKKMDNCPNDKPLLDIPIVVRKKKRLSALKKPSSEQPTLSPDQSVVPSYQHLTSPLNLRVFKFQTIPNENDSSLWTNIVQAYEISTNRLDCSFVSKYDKSAKLTQFLNDESSVHASLIIFYKQIPEFKQVGIDDQTLLIKSNFTGLIHMHHILAEHFRESPHIGDHMSKWISPEFHHNMSKARQPFDRFMEHPLVIQLALIVLLFTFNMSTPRGNNGPANYVNKRHLYESQNLYTTLLWRYLSYLYDEREAARSMQTIVMQVLRYQTLMVTMDNAIQKENDLDHFDPLMLSVLQLT